MRYVLVICACALLSACAGGRPLSEGERAFAADLFGPNFNATRARVNETFRDIPAGSEPGAIRTVRDLAPRPGVCDRVAPSGPRTAPPPAFALYNQINVGSEWYREDMMPGWPDKVLVPESLIIAHELVHIWQWQNRSLTGYRPARAVLENLTNTDPYFYRPEQAEGFLSYGYEQQAALVEDYLCYALYDPDNPRRAELRTLLSPYFTIDRLDASLRR